MTAKPSIASVSFLPLREILLRYLQATTSVGAWPGGDGLTLEDVLDTYPEAVAAGLVPDWQELLRQRPDLEVALHTWLATKDRWQFAYRRRVGQRSQVAKEGTPESAGGSEAVA
jgi:hypothetical protein